MGDFAKELWGSLQWGPDYVCAVLAAKKKSRLMKGDALNCFVLCSKSLNDLLTIPPKAKDELVFFFTELRKSIKAGNFQQKTRFQILYFNEEKMHWSPMDIEVQGSNISIVSFDAANDATADVALEAIYEILTKQSSSNEPEAQININMSIFEGGPLQLTDSYKKEFSTEIPNETTRKRMTSEKFLIQNDGVNCSRMALEHMSVLSQTPDLHKKVSNITGNRHLNYSCQKGGTESRNASYAKQVNLIVPEDLAEINPALYRDMQSLRKLTELPSEKLAETVSTSNTSLFLYVAENVISDPNSNKQINNTIQMKKRAYIDRYAELFPNITPENARQEMGLDDKNRKGLEFINMTDAQRQVSQEFQLQTCATIPQKIAYTVEAEIVQLKKYLTALEIIHNSKTTSTFDAKTGRLGQLQRFLSSNYRNAKNALGGDAAYLYQNAAKLVQLETTITDVPAEIRETIQKISRLEAAVNGVKKGTQSNLPQDIQNDLSARSQKRIAKILAHAEPVQAASLPNQNPQSQNKLTVS